MDFFDYYPPSLAARCVEYLPDVPSMHAWSEMCSEATILEGPGPMIAAARLRMPLGHHPDVRKIMRQAANARRTYLQLAARF